MGIVWSAELWELSRIFASCRRELVETAILVFRWESWLFWNSVDCSIALVNSEIAWESDDLSWRLSVARSESRVSWGVRIGSVESTRFLVVAQC